MRILVTGANGFIGRHVLRQLSKTSHRIIATSLEPELVIGDQCISSQVTYIPSNLNEPHEDFFNYFQQPDVLIHLAWEGLPRYAELFHFEKNLFANYAFLKQMISHGLRDCNVIGTCLEYGLQNGCLSEDMETKPVTPYGLAKDTLRKFLMELQKHFDVTMKWIRLFYLYGEGQNTHSLIEQLKRAIINQDRVFNMSGGEQLRDYLAVETAAEYLVNIALQQRVTGIINCCSGQPISVRKLVENIFINITQRLN